MRPSDSEMLEELLKGQETLSTSIADSRRILEHMLIEHEREFHKVMEPSHDEQHSRLGSTLSRVDTMYNSMSTAIGLFIMAAIGYGVVVVAMAAAARISEGSPQ